MRLATFNASKARSATSTANQEAEQQEDDCAAGQGHCEIEETCRVGRVWQRLNLAIRRSLHDVSLAQLAGIDSSQVRLPTLEREVKLATPRVPVRS